jgi:hypothetical protein
MSRSALRKMHNTPQIIDIKFFPTKIIQENNKFNFRIKFKNINNNEFFTKYNLYIKFKNKNINNNKFFTKYNLYIKYKNINNINNKNFTKYNVYVKYKNINIKNTKSTLDINQIYNINNTLAKKFNPKYKDLNPKKSK